MSTTQFLTTAGVWDLQTQWNGGSPLFISSWTRKLRSLSQRVGFDAVYGTKVLIKRWKGSLERVRLPSFQNFWLENRKTQWAASLQPPDLKEKPSVKKNYIYVTSSTAGNIKPLFKDNLVNWFTKLQNKKPSKRRVSLFCGLVNPRYSAECRHYFSETNVLAHNSQEEVRQTITENQTALLAFFSPLLLTRSAVQSADWAWQLHSTILQTHLPAPHWSSGLFPSPAGWLGYSHTLGILTHVLSRACKVPWQLCGVEMTQHLNVSISWSSHWVYKWRKQSQCQIYSSSQPLVNLHPQNPCSWTLITYTIHPLHFPFLEFPYLTSLQTRTWDIWSVYLHY